MKTDEEIVEEAMEQRAFLLRQSITRSLAKKGRKQIEEDKTEYLLQFLRDLKKIECFGICEVHNCSIDYCKPFENLLKKYGVVIEKLKKEAEK